MTCTTVDDILRVSGEFSTDTVTRMVLPARGIVDSSIFTKFTRVFYLNLEKNSIADITFIEYMPELRVINLADNRITSLAAFDFQPDEGRSFLPDLQALYLQNNRIAELVDIELLKRFTKLSTLNLSGNQVAENYKTLKETVVEHTTVATLNGIRIRSSVGVIIDYENHAENDAKTDFEQPQVQPTNWVEDEQMRCSEAQIDNIVDPALFSAAEERIRAYWQDHEKK